MAAPAKAEFNIQIPPQVAPDPREWLERPQIPQAEAPRPMGLHQVEASQQTTRGLPLRNRISSLSPLR